MKISKTRKIIRNQIKKILLEQEYPKVDVVGDEKGIEDLDSGGFRLGTVEFEGAQTKKWKPAKYYKDITQESKDELWKLESPIPYIYDDMKAYMGKKAFIKKFPDGGKELWETSPKLKKVIDRFGSVPAPAESFEKCIGTPTIGVGHAIKTPEEFSMYSLHNIFEICTKANIDANTQISLDAFLMEDNDIKEIFYEDLIIHMQFKNRITKPITQSMFDALTSLAFNSGWEAKHPEKGYLQAIEYIIRLINRGRYKAAQNVLKGIAVTSKGKRLQNLIDRRAMESELFGKDGINPPKKPKATKVAGTEDK